ncbi:transposase [uncultured Nitrosomonas sp.]|uniref:transposase n=1 Tax=uncultured Nitrosomonas sp. TaxID=156424 RepID=UPI002609F3C7|nr:transposase [uncultured Nitrosomonas sp.]
MKKRFTEEQIIGFLKQAEAGVPVKELCRQLHHAQLCHWMPKNQEPRGLRSTQSMPPTTTPKVLPRMM